MDKILIYLVYLSFVFFILGPLGKFPLGIPAVGIYFTDLAVGGICLIWLIRLNLLIKLLRKNSIFSSFTIFVFIAFLSWLVSPINMSWDEKIISLMYLVRLVAYFSVYITFLYLPQHQKAPDFSTGMNGLLGLSVRGFASNIREKPRASAREGSLRSKQIKYDNIIKWLSFSGLILAGVGWLQYFLYPDLRNLFYLGWDPHYKRIFATFFDPNYYGLIMVIIFILFLSRFKKNILYYLATAFIFITILFTYSRSSFFALIGSLTAYLIARKKYKFIGIILIAFVGLMILLPRNVGGEGVRLERMFSVEQRLDNWKEALFFAEKHPILGVGFNTLRYARREYGVSYENWQESHAGAGVDNSFLFVLATTGLVGLIGYIFMLVQFFRQTTFLGQIILLAVLIHSFFLNSFFYPWVMFILWIILALKRDKAYQA